MTQSEIRWGATLEEWELFSDALQLTRDLLPVVSNPDRAISPNSHMKSLGKTPSAFNREGLVIGLANWTERESTSQLVTKWKNDPDLGMCIITRWLRAFDVDVKDPELSARILAFLQARLTFPIRFRADSAKFLICFFLEGVHTKRVIKLSAEKKGPMVEFLANGQQFVACGTHSDGARYEWDWQGLYEPPTLTVEEFEALFDALVEEFGVEVINGSATRKARIAGAVTLEDDIAKFIETTDFFLGVDKGKVLMTCPWFANHSTDNGDTQTTYMLPGERGYERGHFKCLHSGCASRKDEDFLEAIGYYDGMFEDLGPLPAGADGEPVKERPFFENAADWQANAARMLADEWTHDGKYTLRYAQGDWYLYDGGKYKVQELATINAAVVAYLDRAMTNKKVGKKTEIVPFLPNRNKVNETMFALQTLTHIPDAAAPMWIGQPNKAMEYIALADGILHLPTQTLVPHTPDFFNLSVLPFAWAGSEGESTMWLRFLDSLWSDDEESKETLQMICGYLLSNDTRQQKMFIIKGPPRSGKGTIVRVLGALLGEDNTVSTSFSQLAQTPFGQESLIGKKVAFLPEARNTGGRHANIQLAVQRILSITGEDNVSVERKGQTAWLGKLPTRFLMMANEVPALGDSTEAFASRFIALATTRSFLHHEDKELTDGLLTELPQIMRWCLEGYEKLRKQGRFTTPVASDELMEDIADSNNHVRVFFKECCEKDPNGFVDNDSLYGHYKNWCPKVGRYPESKENFGKALLNANLQIIAGERGHRANKVKGKKGLRVKDCMFESLDG